MCTYVYCVTTYVCVSTTWDGSMILVHMMQLEPGAFVLIPKAAVGISDHGLSYYLFQLSE